MKTYKSISFLLVTTYFFISSCSVQKDPNVFLLPVNGTSNMKYLPKPCTTDSAKSKFYVQGNYQGIEENDSEESLSTRAFELAISRGHSKQNFQFAYGASYTMGQAYYPKYDQTGRSFVQDKKSFGAVLIHGSFNGVKKLRNIGELRYLCLDFGYSKEFGDYPSTRAQIEGNRFYTTVSNTSVATLGLGSEICLTEGVVKVSTKLGIAKNLQNFTYVQGTDSYFKNDVFLYVSLHVNYKGLIATTNVSDNTARVGIGYAF